MAGTLRLGTRPAFPPVPPGHAPHTLRRLGQGIGRDRLVELARLFRQPLTAAMVLALAVTSATMAGATPLSVDAMALEASTNLPNLLTRPLQVLFASAFWVPTAWLFWPLAALLVLVIGAAERRLGGVRTVLLFAIGHVGATLATVAGVAVGVAWGWLPAALATAVDVGPSYGLAAVGAALLAGSGSHRSRRALGLLVTGLALALALDRSPTDAGHLIAALLGLLVAPAAWCFREIQSATTGRAHAPDTCAADGRTSGRQRGGRDREGETMNDSSMTRGRTARWAGTAGLVAAAAVAGGLLMGASNANAATNTPSPSSSSSSTSSSSESTPSTRATYPAHGTAAHEALEKPVTGSNATQAQAAAVKAVGGGTAGAVTTDVSGSGYEVTVTKSDGSQVEVHLNQSFGLDDQGRLSGE